jgi:hypothetical protein
VIPAGRIFFCAALILYGCTDFVYDISAIVSKWFGMAKFWNHFGGAALIELLLYQNKLIKI